jgi:outer membrane protein OmpA-like peptidoglycan-associated protein
MTPRKIFLFSLLAFLMLCAITLAYYLPRLRPVAELASVQEKTAIQAEPSAKMQKPGPGERIESPSSDKSNKTIPQPAKPATVVKTVQAPMPAKPSPASVAAKPAPVPEAATREPDRKLVMMLKNPPIQFEISSATLTSASRKYLDVLSDMLKKQPNIELLIEGHTDSQDRLGKNQVLSEERALAVKTYLTGKGISPDRLDSAGFGGSRPIAENDTAAGRAKNRRIEFRINTP